MNTLKFEKLIQSATGRAFTIQKRLSFRETGPAPETLEHETIYFIGLTLPLTEMTVGFDWKTPKSDEKMLRSFITAFTSKYREPNPATYIEDGVNRWESFSPERKEYAHNHHAGHMFSKEDLLKQVENRFSCQEIESALNQWGFYETEYGIGIFCYWATPWVIKAIDNMRRFLAEKGVAAKEEFSDARWVYRFRVEANREVHAGLIKSFAGNAQLINAN